MIRFYCEMKKAAYQPHAPPRLKCDNFEKIFNIWGVTVLAVGSQPNFDKAAGSNLHHETLRRAQEHLNKPETNDHRYARLLLQSSSLLDIDIIYEPTQLSQDYLNMQPNLPNVKCAITDDADATRATGRRLYGTSCSTCGQLIQSKVYYECMQDCEPYIRYEYEHTKHEWQERRFDTASMNSTSRLRATSSTEQVHKYNEHEILEDESEMEEESESEEDSDMGDECESEMEDGCESEDDSGLEDQSGTSDKNRTKGIYTGKKKQDPNRPTASKFSWREKLAMGP
ncbi:uncharacterized protein BO80DRAFT_445766 [Aspergillus ibericus CBS 121593]|uniref:Uncharacterized protein n=1 Tax=Aspergillus ibericus CBS 121593 TaxID=1448316 RepID=A0A395GZF8_9EURO|nr:hypothetical protein BO80DRAFT_445766 [Aspergillus ibericus CBS 121593]RAL00058.1 hypothetical protein BO80DRAFT_445766 [Aspergillus ibericus CBS 121593]